MEGPRLNCVHLQKQVFRKWMKIVTAIWSNGFLLFCLPR